MLRNINNRQILVKDNDFKIVPNELWFNLKIVDDLPALEQMAGLIRQIKGINTTITLYNLDHSGWLAFELSNDFNIINASFASSEDQDLAIKNLPNKLNIVDSKDNCVWIMPDGTSCWKTRGEGRREWIQQGLWISGGQLHPSYIKGDKIDYDNLINLLIMVKNAGPDFKKVLQDNLHYIDRWTILDTGSTDGTQDIIKEVLGSKPGRLYEESFIDFKVSRNRLLELAGNHCKFNIMLDDTYVIQGKVREFLKQIRGDQFGSSYSLFIKSSDSEYSSNRITKPEFNLKYIHRIHEVIDPKNNVNVMIPSNVCHVEDRRSDYMDKRTKDRKLWDLEILFKEYEEDPEDPRSLYYIAQTYNCLENWEKSFEFFIKRANHHNDGFIQEKIDAIFEAGRTANFKLNKPWEDCQRFYKWAYELDTKRPDSLYFLGIHWYLLKEYEKAYPYFKEAFEVGYPVHAQYSLKPTLSYHFLPKFLTEVSYHVKDWKLGFESSKLFCEKNPQDQDWIIQRDWNSMFEKLLMLPSSIYPKIITNKPTVTFCVDGNWKPWTGSDIETRGMGGSETWAIETARWLSKSGFSVHVFCRCSKPEIYDGVEYHDLTEYPKFISTFEIELGFVSRFSEWLGITYESHVKNVYFWVHDLSPSGIVIPNPTKLRGVFCLSKWHSELLKSKFPSLASKIQYHYYGIDDRIHKIEKIKNRFIYSSTANRGLEHLLDMWSNIKNLIPDASLEVFCDLELEWANKVAPVTMSKVKRLINQQGIIYRGWQSKSELLDGWSRAEFWLYPCVFEETFCLTALEAAKYNVIPITNGLAALRETAGNGIIVEGNPSTEEWKSKVMDVLKSLIYNQQQKDNITKVNSQWANSLTWNRQTEYLSIFNIKSILRTMLVEDNHYHVLKIGAFTGNIPNDEIYHSVDGSEKIILVEPIPLYYHQLVTNFNNKLPSNSFKFVNTAVSNYNGKMKMYYPSMTNSRENLPWWIDQLGSKNIDHCKLHGYDIDLDCINVNVVTINELIKGLKIEKLEFLIIDTEGSDYDIIKSFDFRIKPKYIQFENIHTDGTKNKADKYYEIIKLLDYNGYRKINENESDTIVKLF